MLNYYKFVKIWKVFFVLSAFSVIVFSNTDSFSQTTVDITLCSDNTLYEDRNGETSNGSGQYFFTGTTVTEQLRRGLIHFVLNKDLPQCAIITNVSLKLHMSKTISGDKNVELRKMEKNWGSAGSDAPGEEGTGTQAETGDATWLHTFYNNEFWDNDGGDYSVNPSAITPVGGVGFYTWDSASMIQDVQNWINNPNSNFGWMLLGTEDEAGTAKRFDSFENDSVNFRPVLTVTYTTNFFALYNESVIEGFWNGSFMVDDSIKVTLRNSTSPYAPVYSSTKYSNGFEGSFHCFAALTGGSYYIAVNQRNSIETWSKFPVLFTPGNFESYYFTDAANKAYGNNLVFKLGRYCNYSGDVDQDGVVDLVDGSLVDNDIFYSNAGYIPTDVNGDMIADVVDGTIVDNNSFYSVSKMTP